MLFNFLAAMPGNHIWTGGNDLAKEGSFIWPGSNQLFNYTQWQVKVDPERGLVKQPDNADNREHCVHLDHQHNYDWDDNACMETLYFVCEYKIL